MISRKEFIRRLDGKRMVTSDERDVFVFLGDGRAKRYSEVEDALCFQERVVPFYFETVAGVHINPEAILKADFS